MVLLPAHRRCYHGSIALGLRSRAALGVFRWQWVRSFKGINPENLPEAAAENYRHGFGDASQDLNGNLWIHIYSFRNYLGIIGGTDSVAVDGAASLLRR